MSNASNTDPLAFPPPASRDEKHWDSAEQYALGFPARFRDKCRQFNALQRESQQTKTALEKQFALVVRNLIAMIDTCQAALAEHPAPANVADVSEGDGEQLASLVLSKVVRQSTQLLEQLGVVPVELLGATYETVSVNGQKIDDPFEVVESATKGSALTTPVAKVEAPLWVSTAGGGVRVVRRGMVCL